MKKYHLATFLEIFSSDAIFTNNGNYCIPFCVSCFCIIRITQSTFECLFVHSSEHSNPAKFIWALIYIYLLVDTQVTVAISHQMYTILYGLTFHKYS